MLAHVTSDVIMIARSAVRKEAPDGINSLQRFDVKGIAGSTHEFFVKVAA